MSPYWPRTLVDARRTDQPAPRVRSNGRRRHGGCNLDVGYGRPHVPPMPSRNIRTWMWAEACDLLDQAERLHRQYFRLGSGDAVRDWEPPVDIVAASDELSITVALPGVSAEHVQVRADSGVIVID